ncbi:hypothetical protein PRIPAC_77915 [Pristionchus pacificus]|nr:hypothetical protein PRIPAC_77915 [Pristionchus pacificus]
MPFLLVTGLPASGKSTIVERIAANLRETQTKFDVVVVKDEDYAGYDRNCYTDSNKEKMHRGYIRSCLQKALAKNSIVICDAMNYIKGFRYELFLVGKTVKTTYAVLCVKCDEETSRWMNEQKKEEERYSSSVISELFSRYESPDSRQRWDSPLFLVETGRLEKEKVSEEEEEDVHFDLQHASPRFVSLPLTEIRDWLCEGIQLSENASTATAPLAPPDLLHLLDRVTQQVVQHIICEQKMGIAGCDIIVPCADEGSNTVRSTRMRTMGELSRLRRQFVSFTKSNPVHDSKRIASLFINFLNSSQ